ncbi:Golgin subfamily A member 7/ERF4 family-domain-containing protein [Triangularia setosa]|uniref:Ras modification protein ERF4 n=1 Tax=Triangularia setosa TaxID=2587417 RepID=A0AAN7AAS8_9PEZI|nr:Golgin subfamily A member 7/ERF4 family-domain-containing protein [Podospora setosa]
MPELIAPAAARLRLPTHSLQTHILNLEEAVSETAIPKKIFPTASHALPNEQEPALDASTAPRPTQQTNTSLSPPTKQPPYPFASPAPAAPPFSPVAPGRPLRRSSFLRRGRPSAQDSSFHHQSPFRTRGTPFHHHPIQRISAARLWNPTNSTPRTPTSSDGTARRRRAPSSPPPPPVPLTVTPAPAEEPTKAAAGEHPLLPGPEQRQPRPSLSNRISLHLERSAGAEQRISLPPSVRATPSPSPVEDCHPGPSFLRQQPPSQRLFSVSEYRKTRSRGQSISSRLRVPFGLSFDHPTSKHHREDSKGKGKGKAVMVPPPLPTQPDNNGGGADRYSRDLERGPDVMANNPRLSTASRISGIGSAISSDSSIMGDPDEQPDNGEEWGPQHPCYPHLNPHVPVDSPEYTTTRIIRIRRDWLLEGDLAPTFSNLYPDILDPAGVSEQEFRRVIEKLNSELVPAFSAYNWRNILDGVLGLATGWLWDDFGFTGVKSRLKGLERWIEEWNREMEKTVRADHPGDEGGGVIPPKIMPLRKTGYMSLDIQIPDPEIAPASPTMSGDSGEAEGQPQVPDLTVPPPVLTA